MACPCAVEQSLRWRGGTVRLENDLLAGTDRNYTNGVALALVSHDMEGKLRPDCLPRPLGLYTRFLGRVDPGFWSRAGAGSASQNLAVRFGQAMYTPRTKRAPISSVTIVPMPDCCTSVWRGTAACIRKMLATRCSTVR
jgi:hypothetical protein